MMPHDWRTYDPAAQIEAALHWFQRAHLHGISEAAAWEATQEHLAQIERRKPPILHEGAGL